MKVCFYGLGSIGKRHLRNLHEICRRRGIPLTVHAVRQNPVLSEELQGLVDKVYAEPHPGGEFYDAVFIANPTFLHRKTIWETKDLSNCFFVEKPVYQCEDITLPQLELPKENRYYVAAPLRYTGVIQYLTKFCKENPVYCARAISSSYLPNWRPNVDYRTVYSAHKDMGGGVTIDLIHEWDYLTYLFGFPEEVCSMQGQLSHLEIDSEDLAIYLGKYKDKLVEVHLDYFGRESIRQVQLFTKDMTVTADILNSCITFGGAQEPLKFREVANDKYIREMEYFLSLVENPQLQSTNSLDHALSAMRMAVGL